MVEARAHEGLSIKTVKEKHITHEPRTIKTSGTFLKQRRWLPVVLPRWLQLPLRWRKQLPVDSHYLRPTTCMSQQGYHVTDHIKAYYKTAAF